EVPSSQSALDGVGLGMADDHLHAAVASDGTLYAAVKTSYDTPGYPRIALLVRRPAGTWDNLYPVDEAGTRAIALLDEARGTITVVYTSSEGSGDILYKESPISAIAFGARSTLIPGGLNDATSTKQNLRGDVVILASNGSSAQGVHLEDPGPVGWWRMEEGSGGTLLDASAWGNQATLPAGAAWGSGVEGLSLILNGSGQYGSVPDQASLDITGAITLATWVRPERVTTQHLVKKAVNAATDGYELSLSTQSAGGKPFVRFNEKTNGNLYRVDGTQPYAADGTTWTHLAATYDGSTIRLYVNGALDSSKTASFTIATNALPLTLGTQSDGAAGFSLQGGMDEVRVYPRALSALEVQRLMDHTIAASAGPGGSIGPAGAVTVAHGASQAFTIAPNAGFHVLDVVVDGGSVGAVTTYTFNSVTRSHTIAATFSSGTQHTITASAGPGGSITPSGAIVVAGGASQSFSMIPLLGYHVADVLVDGASVGAVATYTFTNVSADRTIAASFAPDAGPAGLVGWWPMDEGTGTIAHDLAQGLNAGLFNGPTWVTGVEGGALSFDGANDYAQVPADSRLDITSAITIAAWIRPARVATQDVVKKAVNGGTDGYELALSSAGKVFLRFNQKTSADTYRLNSVASYPIDGTWMHVAATYDGATMKMYVNGALDGSVAKTVTIATNANALGIGAQSDGVRWFQGALDDVRLYNRALSAGEIQALLSHTIAASAGPGGSVSPAGAVVV
ncbi:MAG TPA: LamG domain-containing protein, partial [Candidatus Eisenbacteria bacterium]